MTIYTVLLMTNLVMVSPMPNLAVPGSESLNSPLSPLQIEELQPEYYSTLDHRGSGR